MSDRPILMKAPEVRALLDGRKHQTRRVLKPQPSTTQHVPATATWAPDNGFKKERKAGHVWSLHSPYIEGSRLLHSTCRIPYAIGDRLWVREAWRVSVDVCEAWHPDHLTGWIDYQAGGCSECHAPSMDAVDRAAFLSTDAMDWDCVPQRWRPSIHMPRWASRITLTVTNVRVQRLQDISQHDAQAEGCAHPLADVGMGDYPAPGPGVYIADERTTFARLWNSINGPDAWDANPWVCALTFDVAHGNIDQVQP